MTASVYVARQSDLVDAEDADALLAVHFDWLCTAKASHVWRVAFRNQSDTWPAGFVDFVDERLTERERTHHQIFQQRSGHSAPPATPETPSAGM
ncbi:hypothetical protein [Actinoplanes sp. DH11]|uniref:hypothetical protein n=1 Tax=Actinoplanes sp. DH11 TaxID=2857011 RepID=UPI001E53637A|nr:hypothetical protein [Actinoplanes sp. DH11]